MPKSQTPEQELANIQAELAKLGAAQTSLKARQKAAQIALSRQGAATLCAAFAGGLFGTVSKAEASQLAKLIASRGVADSIARLTDK